jgi:hypothetical protein
VKNLGKKIINVMSKIAIATVLIAIEIPDNEDYGYACDWMSETLRNPDIGVLDWAYMKKPNIFPDPINHWDISPMPIGYMEGDFLLPQIPERFTSENNFGESTDFGQTGYWMPFRKEDKRFRIERIDEPIEHDPLESDEVAWRLAKLAGYELDDDGYVRRSPKEFQINAQIGNTKHSISYHDGVKRHNDGSRFFDIASFKSRKELDKFAKDLLEKGYRN